MEARFKPGTGKPARSAGKPGGKFGGKGSFSKSGSAGNGASQDKPWQSRKPARHTPHHATQSSGRSARAG